VHLVVLWEFFYFHRLTLLPQSDNSIEVTTTTTTDDDDDDDDDDNNNNNNNKPFDISPLLGNALSIQNN
jgi:hypothetical protein